MAVEQRGPAVGSDSNKKEGKGEMTKTPISLQDLRKSLYVKAKAEPTWRFWGLYVHVCKTETLQEAYQMAKSNDGAPGIDGVTFEAIEESGVESFLKQIQDELVHNTYQPMRVRKKEIPKDGGSKVRVLSIPTIRDRVVQGALKLILEPIFEADFQSGSYGYRRIPQSQAVRSSLTNDHGGLSSGWRRSTQPHSVLFGTEQLGLVPATVVHHAWRSSGDGLHLDLRSPNAIRCIIATARERSRLSPVTMPAPGELCPFPRRTFRKRI